MTSLAHKLSGIVGEAFVAAGLPAERGRVNVSDRPDLAQFQCNGAFESAKLAKKNPREVAQGIVDVLSKCHPEQSEGSQEVERDSSAAPQNDIFSKVEIAGPGFINLNVTDAFLAGHLKSLAGDERLGTPEIQNAPPVVLDYGGPNIAKPMHVGHLRAAIIGDSLRRIMTFAGYKTYGDVHMGDWGTHLGMLISDYLEKGEENLVLETDVSDEAAVARLMDDMAVRYPRASGAAKENPDLMKRAQEATLKLQNKEEPYYPIWRKIFEVSVAGMKKTYRNLDVHFDLWKGEAHVHDLIAPMVEGLKEKGLAEESEGALVFQVAEENDNKEMPPLIIYKSDGAVMYGTTDMATLVDRMAEQNPEKIIYVVDQRQSLHFEQVFRAAKKSGIVPETVELTHAGFGTMNGPDGKPFKTRSGGVMRLQDLIEMAESKARERLTEANLAADIEEREDVAHKVAIAAIKFADLQNQRQADYVFDLDRLTSFEGKTGPYLLYQAVRIKSLLRKAGCNDCRNKADFKIKDEDRALALLLTELPDYIDASLRHYAPHHLCDYAYRLAQEFSSFYGTCHILSEEDEALKKSRLALCALTAAQLELVLGLLGISVPDRM